MAHSQMLAAARCSLISLCSRQGISAGFCLFQNRADASAAQNSFPQTVGKEFPPVSALPKPARTHPPHKIRSRQTSATNFRRFLRSPNPRGRIHRKKFVPANRRQRISAGFCLFQTRADASTAQNSFPQTVGNEFPPVSACSRTARTHPPHKIRSRKPSATNFRRFLRSPKLRGRIRRAKFVPANRRQRISAGFCLFQTRADVSAAGNSFPPTGGNEFPPVLACSKPARTHPPRKIRSRQPVAMNFRRFLRSPNPRGKSLRLFFLVLTFNGNRYTIYNMSTISESSKSRKGSLIRHFQE